MVVALGTLSRGGCGLDPSLGLLLAQLLLLEAPVGAEVQGLGLDGGQRPGAHGTQALPLHDLDIAGMLVFQLDAHGRGRDKGGSGH